VLTGVQTDFGCEVASPIVVVLCDAFIQETHEAIESVHGVAPPQHDR